MRTSLKIPNWDRNTLSFTIERNPEYLVYRLRSNLMEMTNLGLGVLIGEPCSRDRFFLGDASFTCTMHVI
jgi:hypothetical protein